MKQQHTKYTQINTNKLRSVKKPNPENCENCSHLCAYHCAQRATQTGTLLKFFEIYNSNSYNALESIQHGCETF